MKARARLQLPHTVVINGNKITIWNRVVIQNTEFYQCLVNGSKYLQLITEDELKELLAKGEK